jgi:hypothetical protein
VSIRGSRQFQDFEDSLMPRPEFERHAQGGLQIAVASSPAAYFEGRTSQSERALAPTDALEILRKLGSYRRQNSLALARREMGRIERTLFMLEWLRDPALRRQVTAGINTGEAHDALARAVCFNRFGEIRDRSFENQRHRACGVNLIVAAITLWHIVYLRRATSLLETSHPFTSSLLQHVSPLCWEHVNLTGDYTWHSNKRVAKGLPTHPNTSKLQKRLRRALAYMNFRSVRCPFCKARLLRSLTFVLLLPTDERLVQVKREEHIWDAAFATGISLPALCHQGYGLTRAAKLESPGEVDQSDSPISPKTEKPDSFCLAGGAENSMDFRRATAGAKNKISHA